VPPICTAARLFGCLRTCHGGLCLAASGGACDSFFRLATASGLTAGRSPMLHTQGLRARVSARTQLRPQNGHVTSSACMVNGLWLAVDAGSRHAEHA
jgi:hypothetical protein